MLLFCKKKNLLEIYNYFINMTEEDMSQEFRLKKMKEMNKYFVKKIDQNY